MKKIVSQFTCRFKSSNFLPFRGFTLMELVATISIIVVLSIISGPIYNSYSTKSKMAEGYALIGTIRSAQDQYFSEWGNYLSDTESGARGNGNSGFTNYDPVLGVDARMNKYYRLFNVNLWGSAGNGVLTERALIVARSSSAPAITGCFNRTLAPSFS